MFKPVGNSVILYALLISSKNGLWVSTKSFLILEPLRLSLYKQFAGFIAGWYISFRIANFIPHILLTAGAMTEIWLEQ